MNASIGGSSGVARLNLQQPSELPEHLKASYSTSSIILHPLRPSLEIEHPQPVGDAACLAPPGVFRWRKPYTRSFAGASHV